ncbi:MULTISPECIES: type VII secretion protein EccB [unclassified Saccharopolyspora]|nr:MULTISPECIES: type VII secretion protein EccB [unclassified Saccharopolyspora]MCA1188534.1 type VII secretion protein EccB [Saccharopolyspora sp. 6T]MCA1193276.1 type VII secretion protein EccB [Saccharopolyspora sp. 6V]MCA1225895.1 type VII secretion protein EccB [Saccharopolyspora sp. 6M]MCA1279693.1 type VII secretion protein EccB [Saccharopolyspora sp. 7B]
MASTPTTKSQVQAYQFVLRRMESALVRKDAVMLHDPMGSHKRATIAGAILACIGLIGFLVWGLFGGKGSIPEPGNIVIGKDSGSVYVVTADDAAQKRLIPMLNMASAKLLVMAQGGGQGGQPVEATTVKESALADFPRGPRTGMVNAPNYLPAANNVAEPAWAICDVGQVRDNLGSEARTQRATKVETTVIGGDADHGVELKPDESLFVQDQSSGQEYLIYRVEDLPGRPHTKVVKAQVDRSEQAVMDLYGLNGVVPRTITTNMLNSVPDAPPLQIPDAPSGTVDYMQNPYDSGDVVKQTVAGAPDKYFALLPEGKQEISAGAAAVLHASKRGSQEIPNSTGTITDAKTAEAQRLDMDSFPTVVPHPLSFQQAPTSCLSWHNVGGEHHVTVTVGKDAPTKTAPVKLAQHDGTGPKVDFFYMPAGKAAVVRGASNEAGADSAPIYLVSDQGVIYGIKDGATAQGLGVVTNPGALQAGPSGILRSLPKGDLLDPAQASYVYDSVPVPPGGVNRPPPNPQAQQQSGSTGG